MKEQILLFECDDETLKRQLRQALLPLRLRIKFIGREQYGRTIGELTAQDTSDSSEITAETMEAMQPLSAPMMIFAGLSSSRLDEVLRALRQRRLVIPHKAVVTAHNAAWTPAELFAELEQERQKFAEMQKNQDTK